jgi:putative membrane protein
MKIVSMITLVGIAAFGLAGCNNAGTGTNTTNANTNVRSNGSMNANSNMNMMNSNSMMNSNMSNSMTGNSNTGATGANEFMTQAAESGMAEVELGRLAQTKAQNAEVKKFAQMMVQDHSNSNTELKQLAGKKNVSLPTELNAEYKSMKEKLSGMSGAGFDREYMAGQVADHEKTVNLFQTQADNGTDADAKALAAKTLPTLKKHLEMAREVHGKLK